MKPTDPDKSLELLKTTPTPDPRTSARMEEQTWTAWQERNSSRSRVRRVVVLVAVIAACSTLLLFTANAMGGDHWFQDFVNDFHSKLYQFHKWLFG